MNAVQKSIKESLPSMMSSKAEQTIAVRALRNAAPYIRMYKGKVFVIKAGGGVFGDMEATRQLIEQVAILHQVGIRTVLVHGGGPQLTEISEALGVPTRMVQGRRITDQRSLEVTAMVLNGLINTRILAICRELNIDAVGVSGVDAGLVRAHKRPPVQVDGETVDFGYVGDIDGVNAGVVGKLLDNGLMPVVSPLSADQSGMLLNINADTVAAAIGSALNAEKLILCTGAPGILEKVEDPSTLISYTDLQGLKRLRESGSLADGMLPKARAIEDAIRGGVRRVHVISYKTPNSVLGEVFTNEGTGTLIVADLNALSAAEQQVER
jgi:acetylglutamate kinase